MHPKGVNHKHGLDHIAHGSILVASSQILLLIFLIEFFGIIYENTMYFLRNLSKPSTMQYGTYTQAPLGITSEHLDVFIGIITILLFIGYLFISYGLSKLRKGAENVLTDSVSLVGFLIISVPTALLGYLLTRVITRIEIMGREYTGFIIGLQLIIIGILFAVVGYVGLLIALIKLEQLLNDNVYIVIAVVLVLSLGTGILGLIGWLSLAYVAKIGGKPAVKVSEGA